LIQAVVEYSNTHSISFFLRRQSRRLAIGPKCIYLRLR